MGDVVVRMFIELFKSEQAEKNPDAHCLGLALAGPALPICGIAPAEPLYAKSSMPANPM